MTDWTRQMAQTYIFCRVDPATWADDGIIDTVESAEITWETDSAQLGSASFALTGDTDEQYVRIYMDALQDGMHSYECMGTFLLVQSADEADGRYTDRKAQGYTPLMEPDRGLPPVGYSTASEADPMAADAALLKARSRAPVLIQASGGTLGRAMVAETDDTWLTYSGKLAASAGQVHELTPRGEITSAPEYDIASMSPVFTFSDDDGSILLPDVKRNRDRYDVPNIVEVIHPNGMVGVAMNEDEGSPVSLPSRGYPVQVRIWEPALPSNASQEAVDRYARDELRRLSCVERTVTVSHGYHPSVRCGRAVRLAYGRAGMDVTGLVTAQRIRCVPGCTVETEITYTDVYWRG